MSRVTAAFVSALVVLCTQMSFTGQALAFDLNAKRTVLESGLIVMHAPRHNLPILTATILVKVGTMAEPEGKDGLSNLTASMLLEGTKNRTSNEISEQVDFIGASLGASAGHENVSITLSVLKKDVQKGFELLSDITLSPVFPDKEIQRKKKLIVGSLKRREEDPSFLASKAFRAEVYGNHRSGRLVQGSPESIEGLNRDDLVAFYSTYYSPNNSILSVVGDLTAEELSELLDKYFSSWEPREIPPAKTSPIRPQKRKTIYIKKDLTQANIILGGIGIKRDNPDHYALSVMNYILGGGGFSSRLMAIIRDDMGLAYDVHSYFSTSQEPPGLFVVGVQTKNENTDIVIKAVLEQLGQIRDRGVSGSELADAKAYLTGSFPRRLESIGRISGFLTAVEFYGLGLDYANRFPDYINQVTKQDVRRVALKYLDVRDYVLVVVSGGSQPEGFE